MTDALRRGRSCFDRREWQQAYTALTAADGERSLGALDLEHLATAAYLIGRDAESIELLARAHQAYLDEGQPPGAVRAAVWLAFRLMDNDDRSQAGGWLARGRRLLDEAPGDSVERGYLLLPTAVQLGQSGDFTGAYHAFEQAAAIGDRFHDRDLIVMAHHGQGRALVGQGRTAEGVALLDEAMLAVTSGETSVILAGLVYCSVLSVCALLFDVRRAREWTAALTQWCAAQPDLVRFRGECLVRRAEVLRLQGAWPDAIQEAQRAHDVLARTAPQPIVGTAFYQVAEVHRLRGQLPAAEDAYRQAGQWSRAPRPGLAQLRLAQGQVPAAVAAIRRILDEAREPRTRAESLGPCVDIMIAAGDFEAARAAAQELDGIAAALGAPFLRAVSTRASGQVLLATGDARAALVQLRAAWQAWLELDAPYEVARCRVLIGRACRQLGDHDAAELEFDAARDAFQSLGAAPDAAFVDTLLPRDTDAAPGGLTAREIQVLRLVAAGKTNRAVAAELAISEKTVARHISNIFTKLGLTSRAAATAYAYQQGFV